MKALLVGDTSFLARAVLAEAPPGLALTGCRHDALEMFDFSRFDVVANFALDPRYRTSPYDEALDQDLKVARRVADARCRFVALSSRMVYGSKAPFPAPESAPLAPDGPYGHNKARTEAALKTLVGDRLTVLRLANVFGLETGRNTFFGIALQSLVQRGRITLDTAATVQRDFLPVEDFATAFHRVLANPPAGTFNCGSGVATPLGDVGKALLKGFGRGELEVTSGEERDSFLLDSLALTDRIGPYCAADRILPRCVEIGKIVA